MPIGIVGNAFTQTWANRDRIVIMKRMHAHLVQYGYAAQDMPVLFQQFDKDRDGQLSVREFRTMIGAMGLGLTNARVVQVFESLDTDQSGRVSEEEFIRFLFPDAYHSIYHDDDIRSGGSSDALDDSPREVPAALHPVLDTND